MVDLLDPTTLLAAATFDDAQELVARLLVETDGDALADLLEHAVDNSDRAHACLFLLLLHARGAPTEATGVEIVQVDPPHQIEVLRLNGRAS